MKLKDFVENGDANNIYLMRCDGQMVWARIEGWQDVELDCERYLKINKPFNEMEVYCWTVTDDRLIKVWVK